MAGWLASSRPVCFTGDKRYENVCRSRELAVAATVVINPVLLDEERTWCYSWNVETL